MKCPVISQLHLALKWILLALFLSAFCGVQAQQTWPVRPIRILVPFPAGGSTDVVFRSLGQKLSKSVGQPVIIENRGGAYGAVGASYFIKSAPDDHLFLVTTLTMMSVSQYLYTELGYDPDTDLKPVGTVADTPNVIVASPVLQVHTLKQLAEYGKTHPNTLSYSSGGVGSTGHLLIVLLESNLGIKALHVPYKGNAPAMQALIAGDVQFSNDNVALMLPQIRAGKVQALAVTSPKRLPQLPEMPTVSEAGFPKMTFVAWWGLVAQLKTSQDVITRMNRELQAILQQPDFIGYLREYVIGVLPGTPDDMSASIRKERVRWKKVVEMSGVKAQ